MLASGCRRPSHAGLACLLTVLSASPTCLGAEWSESFTQADHALYAIHALSTQHIWAAGAAGFVARSTDGGATWATNSAGVNDLRAIRFVSRLKGWTAGSFIYATTNGGASWSIQPKPAGQPIEDLCFLSENTGFAVGQAGTILATTNAGAAWTAVSSGTNANLYVVDFVNAQRGWALGFGGAVLSTTNGGASWQSLPSGVTGAFYGADFRDERNGWAVGSDQKVWRTQDGGATWTQVWSGTPSYDLLDVRMVSALCGWAVGRNGAILRTDDAGLSWGEVSNPLAPRHMNAVTFPAYGTGWAVGGMAYSTGGAVASYIAPAEVRGTVRLEGRTDHGGAAVAARTGVVAVATAATDAAGDFALTPPPNPFTLRGELSGQLPVESGTLAVPDGQARRMLPVALVAGDANGDAAINTNDLNAVASAFDSTGSPADINGDGTVDARDLVLTARNQGRAGAQPWHQAPDVAWLRDGPIRIVGDTGPYDSAGRFAPDLVPLDGGALRLYYTGTDGTNSRILSLVSTNSGETWTPEPGARIAPWGSFVDAYSPCAVLQSNGTWRMYFSARTAEPRADIYSAISSNGLDFAVEAGARIAHGGTYDSVVAQSPSLFRNADATAHRFAGNTLRMVYSGNDGTYLRVLTAWSSNGLDWVRSGGMAAASDTGEGPDLRIPDYTQPAALLDISDPEGGVDEDGRLHVFAAVFRNGSYEGIGDAASDDGGASWADLGRAIHAGLTSQMDGGGGGSPTRLGGLLLMTVINTNGLRELGAFGGVPQQDTDWVKALRVEDLSIAQASITVTYDLSVVATQLAGRFPSEMYIGVAVLRNGSRLADMLCDMQPVAGLAGRVQVPIDYVGTQSVVSTGYEVYLWTDGGIELAVDSKQVCWQALAPGAQESVSAEEEADDTRPSALFASMRLAGGGPHLAPRARTVSGESAPEPAAGSDEDSGDLQIVLSQEFDDQRRLWQPGAGGTVSGLATYEGPSTREIVENGPYLTTLVGYTYYNVWGDRATLDAEVIDGAGAALPGFSTPGAGVDPAASPDPAAPLNEQYVFTQYTNTSAQVARRVRLRMRCGSRTVAESLLTVGTEAGAPEYRKTWNPVATFSFANAAVTNLAADRLAAFYRYNLRMLPGSHEYPMVIADALFSGGGAVSARQLSGGLCQPAEGVHVGTNTVLYIDTQDHGPHTALLRLRCTAGPVLLAETNVTADKVWAPIERAIVAPAVTTSSYVRFSPDAAGEHLDLDVRARAWTSSNTNALLRLEVLSGTNVCPDFECPDVPLESESHWADVEDDLATAQKLTLEATYRGSATNLSTDGLRIRAIHPVSGADLCRALIISQGKVWNHGSAGEVYSVTVQQPNPWEANVTVHYRFVSPRGHLGRLITTWGQTLYVTNGSLVRLVSSQYDTFSQDRQGLLEGTQTTTLHVEHLSSRAITSSWLRVELAAGTNGPWHLVQSKTVGTNLVWGAHPQYSLEFGAITPWPDTRNMDVGVGYRLRFAEDNHTYRLRVRALRGAETNDAAVLVSHENVITNPAAALTNTQYDTVLLHYTNHEHDVVTERIEVTITDNGQPCMIGSQEVRLECPYRKVWFTDPPAQLPPPVIVPISGNENAFQVPYEFAKGAASETAYQTVVELHRGGERLFPATNPCFQVTVFPTNVIVSTNGASGTILGRIVFLGGAAGDPLTTDTLLVGFRAGTNAMESSAFQSRPVTWTLYDQPSGTTNGYSLRNQVISRPATNVVRVAFDFATPEYYKTHADEGLVLKGFLWTGLQPLFRPPDNVIRQMQDVPDDSSLEDFRELFFNVPELVTGEPMTQKTTGGTAESLGLADLVGLDAMGTLLRGTHGESDTQVTSYAGNAVFDLQFQPAVGSINVHWLTLCYYRRDGTPVYSQTVPIVPSMGDVRAPDCVGIWISHIPDFQVFDATIEGQNEMSMMVSYSKSSAEAGAAIWLEPLSADPAYPYAPLELISIRRMAKDDSDLGGGTNANHTPYVNISNEAGTVLFRFRLAHPVLSQPLNLPLTFTMGRPGNTALASYEHRLGMQWSSKGCIDPTGARFVTGDYPYQVAARHVALSLYGMSTILPASLAAIPLDASGAPIVGITPRPLTITNYTTLTDASAAPIMEYDFQDSPLDVVTASQVRLAAFDLATWDRHASRGPMVAQRLVKLDTPIRFVRSPVRIHVNTVRDVSGGMYVGASVSVLKPTSAEVPDVAASLGQGEYLGAKVRALWCGGDPPAGVIESYGVAPVKATVGADAHSTLYELLEYSSSDPNKNISNEVEVRVAVFKNDAEGNPIERRGLAYTIVDHTNLWTSVNSYIVGVIDQLLVHDDGDDSGVGEDIVATIGITREVDECNADNLYLDTLVQKLNWPVEFDKYSRWCTTDASPGFQYEPARTDTLGILLPVYCAREVDTLDVLGLGMMLLDDDSIPSWVSVLINIVLAAADLVADAFGQTWVDDVTDFLSAFSEKMLKAGAMPDKLATVGVLTTRAEGWGVDHWDDPDYWKGRVRYTTGNANVVEPTFRTRRVVLPTNPVPMTVTLKAIKVQDVSEPVDRGDGEVYFFCRVMDGKNPPVEGRLPGPLFEPYYGGQLYDMHDGETLELNTRLFHTDEVGPFLHIQVIGWEEDDPGGSDDNDNLGSCTWMLWPHDGTWAVTNLTGTSGREGKFSVEVEVKRQ